MSQLMKIRCNGPAKCENEVDLNDVVKRTVITRGRALPPTSQLQERYVLKCQHCTVGRVIITKRMIKDFLGE